VDNPDIDPPAYFLERVAKKLLLGFQSDQDVQAGLFIYAGSTTVFEACSKFCQAFTLDSTLGIPNDIYLEVFEDFGGSDTFKAFRGNTCTDLSSSSSHPSNMLKRIRVLKLSASSLTSSMAESIAQNISGTSILFVSTVFHLNSHFEKKRILMLLPMPLESIVANASGWFAIVVKDSLHII
jgi:hypothetical protein